MSANRKFVLRAFRDAPDNRGPLAAEWTDKPHRVLIDLCDDIAAMIAETFSGPDWEACKPLLVELARVHPESAGALCGSIDDLCRFAGVPASTFRDVGWAL